MRFPAFVTMTILEHSRLSGYLDVPEIIITMIPEEGITHSETLDTST